MLHVIVCDLGIGIKKSLPLRWDKNLISNFFARMGQSQPDVSAIRVALEIGETSTGADNRGLGLPQIWDATRQSEEGAVTILSGFGLLGHGEGGKKEVSYQYSDSIMGTAISWRVPITRPSEQI